MTKYTKERSATVKLTEAIHQYLSAVHNHDRIPGDDADTMLVVWLGIHGDGGTPGMEHP